MAGVATILVAHRSLFTALQLAGGGYLLYLGLRSLLTLRREAGPPAIAAARSPGEAFRQGFVVNVSNPRRRSSS
jgi:threonine/homoserine/homoserine lactone efflux protein